MSDQPITQLGRYQVERELGRGAMGIVYEARDPLLERTVAIKTILLPGDATQRESYEARFSLEARAAARLSHPAIVTVFDFGREGDFAYMAMELLPGIDLRQRLTQSRLSLREALTLAAEIAEGLAFAHDHGVEHRDIKPANIMLSGSGHAKIMDFGIASLRQPQGQAPRGMLFGTPRYMSPEQVLGRPTDQRTDIFSLGAVIYEMLSGRPAFDGPDTKQLWRNIAVAAHPSLSQVLQDVPEALDQIVDRALAKSAAARYQSARELATDLRNCLATLRRGSEPLQLVDAVPVAAASVATVAGALTDVSAYWPLAPEFDSVTALFRCVAQDPAARSGLGPPPPPPGTLQALLRDKDLRLAAVVLGAGLMAAAALMS
ncbi:serine/threonine protein kinase [Solimonas sp. K1W22B-7]|uniref:serine/threonine-protein kinase n=1 Tax=Solimonas sp. K1W22B-7 TaxID=2303331 RepID=UPI000E333E2F|nr:serine/threonine-protein kinase [Solimonas sp. K1W22B-7]AXQ30900.1 serine/threonine protein kinase [Solimonas sp. K1W22B-7]